MNNNSELQIQKMQLLIDNEIKKSESQSEKNALFKLTNAEVRLSDAVAEIETLKSAKPKATAAKKVVAPE